MGCPHSTNAIASTSLHMVVVSSYLICWSGPIPERLHTTSMYRCVLFSDAGAQVLTISGTVFLLYRRIYLLRMQNAALSPYSIDTNSSKAGSVGFLRSPSQVFPILMFSGLLLRIPRGIILVILQSTSLLQRLHLTVQLRLLERPQGRRSTNLLFSC